ncbi:hypothetical protein GQ607_011976 [Colletotrichum asianum]|uniref:Secreted protein n=1 Tax=Colletotrichum asianum TaxID=702518 RepID=A0A8H3W7L6_9PEZI|nr:hypothetical protein GQ607_011976 [Colletotrichum asianum]
MAAATPFDKPPFFFLFPLCIYRVLAHTIPRCNQESSDSRDSCGVGWRIPSSGLERNIVFRTSLGGHEVEPPAMLYPSQARRRLNTGCHRAGCGGNESRA